MIQLLIIADDFTGALDTGVQFAKTGVSTYVTAKWDMGFCDLSKEANVLVCDTESRHITPQEAAHRVEYLVRAALSNGVAHFYKKTDSTLRGNIGAEIGALAKTLGSSVAFLPSYPKAGRTTVNGRQYVNGVPLEHTPFAEDPLDPMKTSDIASILHQQTEQKVKNASAGLPEGLLEEDAIYVVDGLSEADLALSGQRLKELGRLRASAGCAGFAAYLAELLPFERHKTEVSDLPQNILLLCGSVNEKSMRQLETAETLGFDRVVPPPSYLADHTMWDKPEGQAMVMSWAKALDSGGRLIVQSTEAGSQRMPVGLSQRIAQSMGRLTRGILEHAEPCVAAVFGGDTAIEIMNELDSHGIIPLDEVEPGVPISMMQSCLGRIHLVSKAGGLGTDAVLQHIIDYCGRKKA